MKVFFHFTSGALAGQTKELHIASGKAVTIGRSPQCHLALDPHLDQSASAHHAKVTNEKGKFYIVDTASTYGTFLNGKPVAKAKLKSKDVVRFGPHGPEAKFYLGADLKVCPICLGPLLAHNFVCYRCGRKVCYSHFDAGYKTCTRCGAEMAKMGAPL